MTQTGAEIADSLIARGFGDPLHIALWRACTTLPQDYAPYGNARRTHSDCSGGCRFAAWLQEMPGDWLVCLNPKSHRYGLLTFEHQGCKKSEPPLPPGADTGEKK